MDITIAGSCCSASSFLIFYSGPARHFLGAHCVKAVILPPLREAKTQI